MEQMVFDKFRKIVYEKSGITLGEKKGALVAARVGKRMRVLKIDEYQDYLDYVTGDESGEELVNLLDVISTNVTHFFRESQHFDFMGEILHSWIKSGQRKIRIWSAGCSSGEEPYTISMVINEILGECGGTFDMRILATDISTKILEKAQIGYYEYNKMESVPSQLRSRYLIESQNGWTAGAQLKSNILFKRLNLSSVPFPMNGPMDMIFCRNVMIYFDNTIRKRLLGEFHRLLKPGGYLFVGHSESLTGMLTGMKAVKPSVYIKQL